MHALRALEVTPTQATAELDAERTIEAKAGGGTDRAVLRLRGPVVLQNDGGHWRIVDYEIDGRRVVEAIDLDRRTAQERDGVRVEVMGVSQTPRATTVAIAIANDTGEVVSIRRVAARRGRGWTAAWGDRELRIAPGERRVTRLGWPHPGRELRFALTLAAGDRPLHFDITPRAGVELQPPPRRVPRGLRTLRVWQRLAPLAATIVVVAVLAPDWLPGLLLAVGAGFAWVTATAYRRVGRRALKRGLALTVPALVAGAVLWSGNTESALSACNLVGSRPEPAADATGIGRAEVRSLCKLATGAPNCIAYFRDGQLRIAVVHTDCRWFRWRTSREELT